MKKILYVVCALPAVSATFIDREIRALTAAGYQIRTVSRGTPVKGEVSDQMIEYYKDTLYLDQVGTPTLLLAQLYGLLSRPLVWLGLLRLMMAEKEVANRRDRLRLLKHCLQAAYVYSKVKDDSLSHIHAHFLNAPTTIALCLSRLLGIPFTFTLHGSNIYQDPLMLQTKLQQCKCAVTVSNFNVEYLTRKYGDYIRDKFRLIRCGIDPDIYKPVPTNAGGLPVVLSVGRLVDVKGYRFLLEACHILKKRGAAFKCLIAGDGDERELLLEQRAVLGIEDVVEFLGSQVHDNVLRLLQRASIFVLPSVILENGGREGIPVALMEAMSFELPVVSTRTAGIPELIEDRKEGLLVEHSNAQELAAAIEFLLKDAAARETMGKLGRMKVINEFNIKKVPAQFKAVFE